MPEQVNQLPKRKFKVMNLVWTIIMIAGLFISINVTNTHISVLLEFMYSPCANALFRFSIKRRP